VPCPRGRDDAIVRGRLAALPRRHLALGAAALAIAAAILFAGGSEQRRECSGPDEVGEFGVGRWPDWCWRPYSPASPFNTRLPDSPPVADQSPAVVSALLEGGPISAIVVGDSERDFGNPTYWPDGDDPLVRLDCTKPWGRCEVEGMRIRIPDGAKPAGLFPDPEGGRDWDNHMTVVDQKQGWEYDLWNVDGPPSEGALSFAYGGRTRIDGEGLDSDAIAARYGNLAGIIRAQELREGRIDHALAINVPCTEGFVYPASKGGLSCEQAGLSGRPAPPMGGLLRLPVDEAQLRVAALPAWKAAILRALSRYGAYVSDTTGEADQWSLEVESGATYTSFGREDELVGLAKAVRISPRDYDGNGQDEYWYELDPGVDWESLELLDPCVAREDCSG
jgi:hypothetical protein